MLVNPSECEFFCPIIYREVFGNRFFWDRDGAMSRQAAKANLFPSSALDWGIETVDTIISVCGHIRHVLIGESPRTGGQQMEIIYQKDKGWKFAVAPRTFLAFASVIIAYYAPEHLPKVISILRAALAAS